MDRVWLEERLRQTEQHVRCGEQHVRQQRELIELFKQGEHDTSQAGRLLTHFEAWLAEHAQERDRIVRQLAALP